VTDRSKVQEIIRNLVDNAVKFTTAGSVTVRARPGDRSGWVRVEVADTGPGIRPEHRECIFDAFRQIGQSSTRGTDGIGLGLSIVKGHADALGGTVSIASSVGGGSTFHVDLPCALPGTPSGDPAAQALDEVTQNTAELPGEARPLGPTARSMRVARADDRRP
jgi:signal transduction histidine kinase